MKIVNTTLHTYWPCNCVIWFGYLLAPFTLGLSFLLPNLCVSDGKSGLISAIERQNRIKLREKGLVLTYVQGWSMSWLELSVIGVAKKDNESTTAKEKKANDIEA